MIATARMGERLSGTSANREKDGWRCSSLAPTRSPYTAGPGSSKQDSGFFRAFAARAAARERLFLSVKHLLLDVHELVLFQLKAAGGFADLETAGRASRGAGVADRVPAKDQVV